MKKKMSGVFYLLILLVIVFDAYNSDSEWSVTGKVIKSFNSEKITIANWNLQIFGISKASNSELMNSYADKINDYDIIFVQEIRDESGTAFIKLCSLLQGYECKISSRAGRSSSKEQYGVIYNKSLVLNYIKDFNPDKTDRWERPPIEVGFNLGKYNLTIFNIHIKPDDVKNELNYLDDIILNAGYTALVGDLNSDCNYYNNEAETEFDNLNWIINDQEDTTSGSSNCAYDRIIVSDALKSKISDYGINKDIEKEESDHYLVWFEIEN